jgi:putative transposase
MRYTSDLTDEQWNLISYCFPKPAKTGRPREYSCREVLNAVFYLVRTSCQWRNLPKDLPPWTTVYGYFRRWTTSGLIVQIHTHLRDHIRLLNERKRQPTAGVIDSQSVKASETCAERGYDAGKKINGRKRHILVDTMGLLLMVMVLPADVQDRDGARLLLAKALAVYGKIKLIWADGGYAGELVRWTKSALGCVLEIVKRSDKLSKFVVLPRRWVVERTFGWLGRNRRLNRDHERRKEVAEAMVYLAMCRLMLARWVKH